MKILETIVLNAAAAVIGALGGTAGSFFLFAPGIDMEATALGAAIGFGTYAVMGRPEGDDEVQP